MPARPTYAPAPKRCNALTTKGEPCKNSACEGDEFCVSHSETAPRRCKAHLIHTGGKKRCRKHAVVGKHVCEIHGGATPRGLASVHTTHGRYSKDLPTRLAARYSDAKADPDLVNLSSEIALLDVRIGDVAAKIGTGEAGAIWTALRKAHGKMTQARQDGDNLALVTALVAIDKLITEGASDYQQWGEIVGLVDQRRKLVESESKRVSMLQQNITTERALLMVGLLQSIIVEEIDNPEIRKRIGLRLREITTDNSRNLPREIVYEQ